MTKARASESRTNGLDERRRKYNVLFGLAKISIPMHGLREVQYNGVWWKEGIYGMWQSVLES